MQANHTTDETSSRWRFDHHGLDAYRVAPGAMVQGEQIARRLPRGYGVREGQLQRA